MKRTLVKELPEKIGEEVLVKGWAHRVRELGEIAFVIVRERTGMCQAVISKEEAKRVTQECVIEIVGTVKKEPRAKQGVEIVARKVGKVCQAKTPPVSIAEEKPVPQPTLVRYRPVSLRRARQRAIHRIHSELIHAFREFMRSQGFTEIQSTKITSGGLEGGSEIFEVAYFGKKAYLAQSPQFYKQMMVGVFERVFEVGKVYRAEPHATTRHLAEYVGLDYEMGFIESVEEVMQIEEEMLRYVFEHLQKTCKAELELFGAKVPKIKPIPRIPFSQAIEMLEKVQGKKFTHEDLTPEMEKLLCELVREKLGSELVFVTKYPSKKRPFYTMPSPEPGKTESFDLLFRGLEITTGGQRIHSYEKLVEAIKQKGMKKESFKSYLMCFKHGMPPHGGLGIGSERIVKQLLGLQSVEEVSLIPRTKERFMH